MRIVSQNKEFDIPYDHIIIQSMCICYSNQYSIYALGPRDKFLLGSYDSEERVLEVMGNIRDAYFNKRMTFTMPEK